MMKKILFVLAAMVLASLAHGANHGMHAGHAQHPITVHAPFVRLMPAGQPNTGAFMVLENSSSKDVALVKAESAVAKVVELHTHTMVDGMMQMREIPRIAIPAGQRTELKPGGLHVMLIGLHQPLQEGQQVTITLIFDDGSRQQISAPVRHPGSEMPMHHGHAHAGHGMAAKAARDVSELSSPLMTLTPIIGKNADVLELSAAQRQILKDWVATAPAKRNAVEDAAVAARAALRQASIDGAPEAERSRLAKKVGELEAELVLIRSNCIAHWQRHLNAVQYAKALELAGVK
jgi:copper(I)-binding protein